MIEVGKKINFISLLRENAQSRHNKYAQKYISTSSSQYNGTLISDDMLVMLYLFPLLVSVSNTLPLLKPEKDILHLPILLSFSGSLPQ